MGGGAGGLITQRWQSGTCGSRTLSSILASNHNAGSAGRIIKWHLAQNNNNLSGAYGSVFNIHSGQFQSRSQWFLSKYT
jgi:hypothetical protein